MVPPSEMCWESVVRYPPTGQESHLIMLPEYGDLVTKTFTR